MDLEDVIADAMIEHGPDGHCDGVEEIAKAIRERFPMMGSAPELYEALKGMVKAYESLDGSITAPGSWHSHAVEALTKARGEYNEN